MSSEFSFTSVTLAPLVLFFVFLCLLRWVVAKIIQARRNTSLDREGSPSGDLAAFEVDVDDEQPGAADDEAQLRAMLLFNAAEDQRRRKHIRGGCVAVFCMTLLATYWFYYDAIGRRWRGLDEFVMHPASGRREMWHPDDGRAKHPYLFSYCMGLLLVLAYVLAAITWRYGSRAGQLAAAAADYQMQARLTKESGTMFSSLSSAAAAAAATRIGVRGSSYSCVSRVCSWRATIFLVGLLIVTIAGVFVTVVFLSRYMLFCDYKPADFERLCDFAHDLTHEIEAVTGKKTIWLHNGALLAAWRPFNRVNNGFIPNDHDFDLCMERDDFNQMHRYFMNSTRHYWYYTTMGSHPQKVRIYPSWSKVYEGHSGMWCVDIDECNYRHDPLVTIDACNGHFWSATSKRDSIAYFKTEYPQGPWNVSIALNHNVACALLPGW